MGGLPVTQLPRPRETSPDKPPVRKARLYNLLEITRLFNLGGNPVNHPNPRPLRPDMVPDQLPTPTPPVPSSPPCEIRTITKPSPNPHLGNSPGASPGTS